MKRFTETAKWSDPWFRGLTVKQKCVWLWLCDNCDCAGVLPEIDWGLVSFQIGEPCTSDDLAAFAERMEPCGRGFWLRKFVAFQWGYISEEAPSMPHRGVLKALEKVGIPLAKAIESLPKGFPKGCETLKDKDKDKEQEKSKIRQAEPSPLEAVYQLYPRKVGKGKALKEIGKAIARGHSRAMLQERTAAFAMATTDWPADEKQFIPYPATWFAQDRFLDDPTQWERRKPSTADDPFLGTTFR